MEIRGGGEGSRKRRRGEGLRKGRGEGLREGRRRGEELRRGGGEGLRRGEVHCVSISWLTTNLLSPTASMETCSTVNKVFLGRSG